MTRAEAITELVRIWHSPHLDLILKARLGEVIEALKENNLNDVLVRDEADACKESESKLDLIRREDAREAIEKLMEIHFDRQVVLAKARDAIVSLPSAEPPYKYSEAYVEQIRTERDILQDMVNNMAEPKTGEWIQKDMYADRFCSECNYAVWDSEAEEYNFCPNCGAKMTKGGDDE